MKMIGKNLFEDQIPLSVLTRLPPSINRSFLFFFFLHIHSKERWSGVPSGESGMILKLSIEWVSTVSVLVYPGVPFSFPLQRKKRSISIISFSFSFSHSHSLIPKSKPTCTNSIWGHGPMKPRWAEVDQLSQSRPTSITVIQSLPIPHHATTRCPHVIKVSQSLITRKGGWIGESLERSFGVKDAVRRSWKLYMWAQWEGWLICTVVLCLRLLACPSKRESGGK